MTMRAIQLCIHDVFPFQDGVRVYARCCEEAISVGDHFDLVYELLGHLRINPVGADFTVVSLKAYGKTLDSISPGLTAEVVLVGKADRPLKDGDILGTKAHYKRSPRDKPGFDTRRTNQDNRGTPGAP
ncbi:MAG: hypothetical protein N3A38_17155 [Planctomycetota bacterium]|nr:hypothetical protein [Planctomycetota bacterium]